jgi:hypothetical protein
MQTIIENRIQDARERLDDLAISTTDNLPDVAKQLGALTIACSQLLEIVAEQQRQIEVLEARPYHSERRKETNI